MMRLHFRLQSHDKDLISLKEQTNFSELVKDVIWAHLTQNEEYLIPLPPAVKVSLSLSFYLKIEDGEVTEEAERDQKIHEWILSLAPGNRITIIKILIRDAMEEIDWRPFHLDSPLPVRRKKATHKTLHPTWIPPIPPVNTLLELDSVDDEDNELLSLL